MTIIDADGNPIAKMPRAAGSVAQKGAESKEDEELGSIFTIKGLKHQIGLQLEKFFNICFGVSAKIGVVGVVTAVMLFGAMLTKGVNELTAASVIVFLVSVCGMFHTGSSRQSFRERQRTMRRIQLERLAKAQATNTLLSPEMTPVQPIQDWITMLRSGNNTTADSRPEVDFENLQAEKDKAQPKFFKPESRGLIFQVNEAIFAVIGKRAPPVLLLMIIGVLPMIFGRLLALQPQQTFAGTFIFVATIAASEFNEIMSWAAKDPKKVSEPPKPVPVSKKPVAAASSRPTKPQTFPSAPTPQPPIVSLQTREEPVPLVATPLVAPQPQPVEAAPAQPKGGDFTAEQLKEMLLMMQQQQYQQQLQLQQLQQLTLAQAAALKQQSGVGIEDIPVATESAGAGVLGSTLADNGIRQRKPIQ